MSRPQVPDCFGFTIYEKVRPHRYLMKGLITLKRVTNFPTCGNTEYARDSVSFHPQQMNVATYARVLYKRVETTMA